MMHETHSSVAVLSQIQCPESDPLGMNGTPPLKLACGNVGEGYCFYDDFVNGWFYDA